MIPRAKGGPPNLILVFDIENRPLTYYMPDYPTAQVTAIAWWFVHDREMEARLLGRDDMGVALHDFRMAYNAADLVVGHYIRRHDLPILNAAMIEEGMPPLGPKLVQDTKMDLVKFSDIPKTQEHLAEMFGVRPKKYHMTQQMWREANMLTHLGLSYVEKRVTTDVRQSTGLRKALLEAGLLSAPQVWRPSR